MTLAARLGIHRAARRKKDVLSGFIRRVAITDFLVICWAVLSAQLLRFGPDSFTAMLSPTAMTPFESKYTVFSAGLIVTWLLMLRVHRAYDHRILGHGPEEYKVVATTSFRLFVWPETLV